MGRIMVSAHLPWVLHALPRRFRREKVYGQGPIPTAQCRGRRRVLADDPPFRGKRVVSPPAKALIPLEPVGRAVDSREIIPHPQQVRVAAAIEEIEDALVCEISLLVETALVLDLLDLHRAEQHLVVACADDPFHVFADDGLLAQPHLEHGARTQHRHVDPDKRKVPLGDRRRLRAESDRPQHAVRTGGQQRFERFRPRIFQLECARHFRHPSPRGSPGASTPRSRIARCLFFHAATLTRGVKRLFST